MFGLGLSRAGARDERVGRFQAHVGGEMRERRTLVRVLVPAVIVGAMLVGVRLWEKREYQTFFDFHDARTELMDYHSEALDSVSQETLDALGWDASEVELVRQWYFMDENITADALRDE